MRALVDNDIIFKGACYGLLSELFTYNRSLEDYIGVLGAMPFVVSKRIARSPINKGATAALANLEAFMRRAVMIEPTEGERSVAGEFELAALRSGVSLDTGESQLCAVLITRLVPVLLTGDKRAISAMEHLLESDARLEGLCGKVKCLEQLMLDSIIETSKVNVVREAICSESHIDKALAICFACSSKNDPGEYLTGLQSYIADLRAKAARILSA